MKLDQTTGFQEKNVEKGDRGNVVGVKAIVENEEKNRKRKCKRKLNGEEQSDVQCKNDKNTKVFNPTNSVYSPLTAFI